jgi:hypothetical protein
VNVGRLKFWNLSFRFCANILQLIILVFEENIY